MHYTQQEIEEKRNQQGVSILEQRINTRKNVSRETMRIAYLRKVLGDAEEGIFHFEVGIREVGKGENYPLPRRKEQIKEIYYESDSMGELSFYDRQVLNTILSSAFSAFKELLRREKSLVSKKRGGVSAIHHKLIRNIIIDNNVDVHYLECHSL